MSCFKPRKIYTNSHYLSLVHYRPFVQMVPCGRCSECRKALKREWRLRAFYHAKDFFSRPGKPYILFDTLTYNDQSLPRLHEFLQFAQYMPQYDIPCFNSRHVSDFIDLLRKRIQRLGYEVKGNLDFFYSSEYGSDNLYVDHRGRVRRGTRRPHYHILFYCSVPGLSPAVLSKAVSDAWSYGITDGIEYQGYEYLMRERVFYCSNQHCMGSVGYVSKYVSKQIGFDDRLRSAIGSVLDYMYPSRFGKNTRKYFTEVYRKCCQRHGQSRGFGAYALQLFDEDYLVDRGSLPMLVSKKCVSVDVPLPMYYRRKLLSERYEYNGSRLWRPSERGRKYYLKRFDNQVNNYCDNVSAVLSGVFPRVDHDGLLIKRVDEIMEGRNWFDYAGYVLGLRGRVGASVVSPRQAVEKSVSKEAFDYDWLKFNGNLLYVYNTVQDCCRFGRRMVSDQWLGDVSVANSPVYERGKILCDLVSSEHFARDHVIDDTIHWKYNGFDELYEIISDVTSLYNEQLEDEAVALEKVHESLQDVGLL